MVATPGRLIDLMDREVADLSGIEFTVLDEADHMADLGFLPAVSQVLDTVPDGGDCCSRHLGQRTDHLVHTYLHEPVKHQVDTGQASVPPMSHHLVSAPQHKAAVTAGRQSPGPNADLRPTKGRPGGRAAARCWLALHGGLAQGARTRIMSAFKHGSLPVLVATDVAARGIHVDEVGLVLHADPPTGPKEYLHRGAYCLGGRDGHVVAFALPHQRRELGRSDHAGGRTLRCWPRSLETGTRCSDRRRRASGDAISDAAYQRVIAPPPARRSQSARERGGRGVRTPGPSGRRQSPARPGPVVPILVALLEDRWLWTALGSSISNCGASHQHQ